MKQALQYVLSNKAKRGCALLWLGVFLFLQAMLLFPAVHQLVHPDSGDADHQCAVTLFAHGQVDCSDTAVPVIRSEPVAVFIQSWREAGFVSLDLRLIPGRDPPSPLSFIS